MELYLSMAKVYARYQLMPFLITGLLVCLLSPFLMGTSNLDLIESAKLLEGYISILGLILLVPIFYPDQDKEIYKLIRSKREATWIVVSIRMIESLVALAIIIAVYLAFLKLENCHFPYGAYYYGTMSSALFLGGIGVLVYALVDNMPLAYALPILYYMICHGSGSKYTGKFYLFSMIIGKMEYKIYLLIGAIVLIGAGVMIRNFKYKSV